MPESIPELTANSPKHHLAMQQKHVLAMKVLS